MTGARRSLAPGLENLPSASLDRSASTLSTGERQRMQLARAVRNRTTGVLYVLDEPSIGLHPSNMEGLTGVMQDLLSDGNSVILVDHDVQVLKRADHLIEMGPLAGSQGGTIVAQGSLAEIIRSGGSKIAPFLAGTGDMQIRRRLNKDEIFNLGRIRMRTAPIHTVRGLNVELPKGRLTAVTGVSGSGKTTMVLESLVPGLEAHCRGEKPPFPVLEIEAEGIKRVNLIDASPIGINIRSTVATYSGVLDDLRKLYAGTEAAKSEKLKAGDFSYNTGSLRCQTCDGTGQISLDVQFLPDVTITCPDCGGKRYGETAERILWTPKRGGRAYALPELLSMTVDDALEVLAGNKKICARLAVLRDLGLGYLTLGEDTPALSGGEAQRLKLASEMGKTQEDAVFVFDEPTIGLHPLDVQVLLRVFDRLVRAGAAVVVIEHDLDVIANADYIIDMGPGGGEQGGRIVACGTAEEIKGCRESVTGRYL